jgi:hypothetical protein
MSSRTISFGKTLQQIPGRQRQGIQVLDEVPRGSSQDRVVILVDNPIYLREVSLLVHSVKEVNNRAFAFPKNPYVKTAKPLERFFGYSGKVSSS